MTEKEALKWLKDHVEWYEKEYQFPNPNNEQVAVYKVAIKALKERPQGTSDCIPVKDLINYIRNCREELFEKMKDYNLREFEIRDSMLTNFEQLVRLASSKYKNDMRGRE